MARRLGFPSARNIGIGFAILMGLLVLLKPVFENGLAGIKSLQIGGFFLVVSMMLALYIAVSIIDQDFIFDRKKFLMVVIAVGLVIAVLVFTKIETFSTLNVALQSIVPIS